MIAEIKESLTRAFARRKAERAATLAEAADRQAAGEEIDIEDLADLIEAAGETHETYLAMIDSRAALRRCREQIAAASDAESKLAGIDKQIATIDAKLERAQAEAQAARRPLLADRESLIQSIHCGTSAKAEIHRIAPESHKQAVATLSAKRRSIEETRAKAQRSVNHCRGQLREADERDRPGIERLHPDARRNLEASIARHLATIAEADSAKREIEAKIADLEANLYTGDRS